MKSKNPKIIKPITIRSDKLWLTGLCLTFIGFYISFIKNGIRGVQESNPKLFHQLKSKSKARGGRRFPKKLVL